MESKAKIKKIGDGKHGAINTTSKLCSSPIEADMADVVDAELKAEESEHVGAEWCKKHNTRKGNCGCLWESKIN
jgi:hypothetical protein